MRHLLAHTAGLPDWDDPMTVEDLYDWPAATARLAAQAPRWEPGALAGYHSLTQGFLVGEVVRRVTGRSLGVFFAEEVGYGIFGRSRGWGGWGGSLVMVDLDARMTVSYVMNQMLDQRGLGDYRALGIVMAAYEGLQQPA